MSEVKVCKFGIEGCNRLTECVGAHPDKGESPSACKYKGGCNRRGKCTGSHPQVCRDDGTCKRDDCFFTHTKKKKSSSPGPCKYGDNCKFGKDCRYEHEKK